MQSAEARRRCVKKEVGTINRLKFERIKIFMWYMFLLYYNCREEKRKLRGYLRGSQAVMVIIV
jgi:hypothetical protein